MNRRNDILNEMGGKQRDKSHGGVREHRQRKGRETSLGGRENIPEQLEQGQQVPLEQPAGASP